MQNHDTTPSQVTVAWHDRRAARLLHQDVDCASVLLLVSQHIDHVIWVVNMLIDERVVRELLGGAPPCRRPSREAQGWRISWGSTAKRTRKSPTEVPRGRAVRVALPSAICQLPATARSSRSSKLWVPSKHPLYTVHEWRANSHASCYLHSRMPSAHTRAQ